MAKIRDYKQHLLKQLQDPKEVAAYLNAALEEDPQTFLLALRDVVEAQGGMTQFAKKTELNRESLYKTLSLKGNPRLFNLITITNAAGVELSFHAGSKRK